MTDSTNPRILANNIRRLFQKVNSIAPGTVVEANPTGEAASDLEKLKVAGTIYGIPKGGTVKAGQSTLSGGDSYTAITTAIAFQTPMADTNYAVTITQATADSEGPMYVRLRTVNKTVNGFTVECFSNEAVRAFKVDWIAAPYEPVAPVTPSQTTRNTKKK